MDPSTWLALLSLSCLAAGQTYSPLSPALIYTEGAFTSPDNTVQQTYQNGSTMVISWYANYTTINLFQVFNNDYSIQWGLANELSSTSFTWIVNDHGNNTDPFAFRIVNTYGTEDEQLNGGFASGQFWISPGISPVTVTVQEITTSAVAPLTTSLTTSTTDSTTGSTLSTTASTTTATSSTPASPNTTSTPLATTKPSTNNSVAIGVGVGVSVGVLLVALAAFLAWWFLRRRRSHEPVAQQPPVDGAPDQPSADVFYSPDARSTQVSDHSQGPVYEKHGSPPLPADRYGYYKSEQQVAPVVEAPNGWDEAHELHANSSGT